MANKGFQDTDYLENIVGKGEIAHFEHFTFLRNVFQRLFLCCVKMSIYMEQRVKALVRIMKSESCLSYADIFIFFYMGN